MKKDIGFIAVGQAGGNIGMLLEKQEYNVLFINTSSEDLDTLKTATFKYHIPGGEGCNKDRNKAKKLVIENFENILQQIQNKIQEEFIFVIFSSGGGTGSGASPMLIDLLSQHFKNRSIGAITILPSELEPLKTHINSYECFKELADIEGLCSTFVLDNNRDDRLSLNREFVDLFNSIMDIPEFKDMRGNIDRAELKELLKTKGNSIILKFNKSDNDTAKIINSLHNNIFAPIESDKVIKYIGISSSGRIDMEAIKKETGLYLDAYRGYNKEQTICILSGLTLPFTRLIQIRDKVKDSQEIVEANLKATSENKLKENINFLSYGNTAKSTTTGIKDIFAKYLKK